MTANETTLRAKLAKNPGSLLFAWLAEELRQSRNLDAALPVVEEGLARNSDFLPGLLVRGKILFDMNALEEAEATFRKVFRKDPFCLSAVRGLADIATKLNRKTLAEQYLRILHTMDPLDESLPPVAPLVPTALIPRAVPLEDDPFALLTPAPAPDTVSDGPTALELAGMLDAALDGVDRGPSQPEFFPADDDSSVTSTDVGSAISSLFSGLSASAKPAAPEAEIGGESPFSKMSAPPPRASVPPPPVVPVVSSPVQAPEVSDLHGALDSLFGDDDDFVEESASSSAPVAMTAPAPEPEPAAPPPVVAPAGKQELETDLASALDDLFGEDDAFEEPTLAQAASTPDEPSDSITASGSDQSLDLDALLNEQLSSKSDLPDFSSNISDALNGPVSDEELPGFGSPPAGLSGRSPDLDALLNEQLSSKSDLPDFSSGISDALNGPVSDEELPGFGSPPAGLSGRSPDLNALLNEQLSSKSDLPDFSSDISDALNGPVSEDELPGFSSSPKISGNSLDLDALLDEQLSFQSDLPDIGDDVAGILNVSSPLEAPGKAPDLDALLNEQLASKSSIPDFSADISAALEQPAQSYDLQGKSVEPAPSSGGANDFSSEVKGVLDNLFADDDLDFPQESASKAVSGQSSDLKDDVGNAFDSLFDDDADELLAELAAQDHPVAPQTAPIVVPEVEKEAPAPVEEPPKEAFDDVASALDRLFDDDDSLDSLFSDDNDDLLRHQLQNNPLDSIASVANEGGPQKLTPTLAEIYLQQGLVGKALQAYRELVAEKPNDKNLQARLAEIEKLARQS